MKRMLSMLSMLNLTIVTTSISNSCFLKQMTETSILNNYGYEKNWEGIDYRWATTHYHTMLFIKIKKESWANILNNYDTLPAKKFNSELRNFIQNMHRDDRVKGNDYNKKIFNVIINNFDTINNRYKTLPNNVGLDIVMRSSGELNFVDRQ